MSNPRDPYDPRMQQAMKSIVDTFEAFTLEEIQKMLDALELLYRPTITVEPTPTPA